MARPFPYRRAAARRSGRGRPAADRDRAPWRRTIVALGVVALAAAVFPAGAGAATTAADAPAADGQVVLELSAQPGAHAEETATFESPNGAATLRVRPGDGARGQVRVNGGLVADATQALARGETAAIDVSALTERGSNDLEVRLVRGDATVSIDHPVLVDAAPGDAGVDPDALAAIDEVLAAHAGTADDDLFAGAVALVAYRGQVVHESAVGYAEAFERTADAVVPLDDPRGMTVDTVFDLASITKVAAATAAVMNLVDDGRLDLDDTVGEHLDGFDGDKAGITVRQLITHRSGLLPWQPTWMHAQGAEEVLDYLAELELGSEGGASRTYSDLGFMLLRAIVESVTGQPFDAHVRSAVHEPLGMLDTRFLPGADDGPFAATSHGNPYEYGMVEHEWPYEILGDVDPADFDGWREYTLVGEVNDGNTWYGWEGVSGHAGLFATARDLARFAQTMVNGGGYGDHTFVSPETVATFLETPYDGVQAHGFLTGRLGDGTGYGHNGFTGTEFAFDPERELVVVLLTNRQHQGDETPWEIHPSNLYPSIFSVWSQVRQLAVNAVPAS